MGLEIGLDVLEKFWNSFGNSLVKMCGNPVLLSIGAVPQLGHHAEKTY